MGVASAPRGPRLWMSAGRSLWAPGSLAAPHHSIEPSGGGNRACPIAASAARLIRALLRRNGDPTMTATTLHERLPASIPNVPRVPSGARADGEPSLIIVVSPGASP